MRHGDEVEMATIEEIENILFKDKEGGVRYDIRTLDRRKVSWKALAGIASLLIVVWVAFMAIGREGRLEAARANVVSVKYNAECIAANTKSINTLISQQEGLGTNIAWIKKSLERMEDRENNLKKGMKEK